MREIKFRAWDKIEREMISWKQLCDQIWNVIASIEQPSSNWAFMQYIGLKDKNGKDIYEGDVVEFAGYKRNYIEVIEWDNIAKRTSFGGGTHNARVLGNIYENPELSNK